MIVLAGTRAELQNYLRTIEIFDVDWLAGMSVGVFPLQSAEAGKVVTELEKMFGERQQDAARRHVPLHAAGRRRTRCW